MKKNTSPNTQLEACCSVTIGVQLFEPLNGLSSLPYWSWISVVEKVKGAGAAGSAMSAARAGLAPARAAVAARPSAQFLQVFRP